MEGHLANPETWKESCGSAKRSGEGGVGVILTGERTGFSTVVAVRREELSAKVAGNKKRGNRKEDRVQRGQA